MASTITDFHGRTGALRVGTFRLVRAGDWPPALQRVESDALEGVSRNLPGDVALAEICGRFVGHACYAQRAYDPAASH